MIEIKVNRASKSGVQVHVAVEVSGTQRECVEEFAGVLSALRQACPEIYFLAVTTDIDIAKEELENGDEE